MNGLKIMKLFQVINEVVVSITHMSKEEHKVILRSFARLSIETRIELMKTHRSLFHKLRQFHKNVSADTLSYCALILVTKIYINEQKSLKSLNINEMSLEEIQKLTSKKAKLFLKKQLRQKTKQERLIDYWAVVKTLKYDEKFSFRQIENYLKKYHKFAVSYSLIARIWSKLENKK